MCLRVVVWLERLGVWLERLVVWLERLVERQQQKAVAADVDWMLCMAGSCMNSIHRTQLAGVC